MNVMRKEGMENLALTGHRQEGKASNKELVAEKVGDTKKDSKRYRGQEVAESRDRVRPEGRQINSE